MLVENALGLAGISRKEVGAGKGNRYWFKINVYLLIKMAIF